MRPDAERVAAGVHPAGAGGPAQGTGPGKRPPMSVRVKHMAILLLVGVLWGVQPALIKVATDRGLSEIEALSFVLVCVVGLVGGWLAATGRLFRLAQGQLRFFATAGVLEYAAPLVIAFLVAPHIDSALLTLIMSTTPVFTVPLAAAVGSDPLTRNTVLAVGAGILAMAALVVPQDALPSPDMLVWCMTAFAVPALYSCGSVYVSKAWPVELDAIQVAFGSSLFACILLVPFSLQALTTGSFSNSSWWGAAGFGLLAMTVVVEMILYFYLIQNAGPVFTSFSSFIMIVSGFAVGILIFGEKPTVWVLISMALFVVSLILVLRAPRAEHA